MAKKQNAYLAKQANLRKVYTDATETVMRQFMIDTIQIAAAEEFGFGADRIERLIKRWGAIYSKYYPALNATSSAEADVLRCGRQGRETGWQFCTLVFFSVRSARNAPLPNRS